MTPNQYIKFLKNELNNYKAKLVKYLIEKKHLELKGKNISDDLLVKIKHYKNEYKKSEIKMKKYLLQKEEIEKEIKELA